MAERYTARSGRKQAKTLLTDGEKHLLYRLQSELKTENESDTIRQALRKIWAGLGWLA